MKIDTGGRMLTLDHENMWYETVSHAVGIPKVHWFGEHDFATVMVLDALGPSLDILLGYCDDRFSLKTVLLIAKQALHRIQHIHSKGVLHCDLKPDNFLMGTGKQGNVLYVIDFGVTTTHDVVEGEEQGQGRPFRGTAEFASINALRELSRFPPQSILDVSVWFHRCRSANPDNRDVLGRRLGVPGICTRIPSPWHPSVDGRGGRPGGYRRIFQDDRGHEGETIS